MTLQWQIVFVTTAAVLLVGFAVYSLFGTADEQPWNQADPQRYAVEAEPLETHGRIGKDASQTC